MEFVPHDLSFRTHPNSCAYGMYNRKNWDMNTKFAQNSPWETFWLAHLYFVCLMNLSWNNYHFCSLRRCHGLPHNADWHKILDPIIRRSCQFADDLPTCRANLTDTNQCILVLHLMSKTLRGLLCRHCTNCFVNVAYILKKKPVFFFSSLNWGKNLPPSAASKNKENFGDCGGLFIYYQK